jgi:small-conductance mechanosensitive channel
MKGSPMNSQLQSLVVGAEGRYFHPDERQALLARAASLPERFQAAEQVQEHEEAIVQAVMEEMQQRHPESSAIKGPALAKTQNDVQLVLRFDVQAMILDDVRWLDEKVLFWLRTILAAGNFRPDFSRDCFTLLREQLARHTSPHTAALLEPYLKRNIEVLSDLPEPAAASA